MEIVSRIEPRRKWIAAGKTALLAEIEAEVGRVTLVARWHRVSGLSRQIERGSVGNEAKRLNGYKCQLCERLGRESLGFKKRDGFCYVEAHHVVHVSTGKVGVLDTTNVITVCPNHLSDVETTDLGNSFRFTSPEGVVEVRKFRSAA